MDPQRRQQAKDLTLALQGRPASERPAFLLDRCTDDASRAEVEDLLAEKDRTKTLDHDRTSVNADVEVGALLPGAEIGPYLILGRLGRGGMGEVFLGNDPRLRRRVALKCVLSSRLVGDDLRSQILKEARAAARISHPNIATVYDVLELGSRIFIVMEYVEGESLAVRIKRERLPISTVIAVGRQLAAAIGAAHANGIIHRDLKPANVQITADDSVKVLDFGIAKAIPIASTTRTVVTQETEMPEVNFGTPGYMSPEHALCQPVDERSDIYSLGIVLFEMATGRGPLLTGERLDQLFNTGAMPTRPDAANPALPSEFSDILERALNIDPRSRWQTADEFETALARLLRPYPGRTVPLHHVGFAVRLSSNDWDPVKGGWSCPALQIPTASVNAMYVSGVAVDATAYMVNRDQWFIRWSADAPPKEASVQIEVARNLSLPGLTRKWKTLAIVVSITTALAAGIGSLAFLRHQRSDQLATAERPGLLKTFPQSNDFLTTGTDNRFVPVLTRTKHDAWFAGTTFYISVDQFHDLLLAKLAEGVNLHFLILNPDNGNAREVARLLGVTEDELYLQCVAGIRTLRRLERESRQANYPGVIQTKLLGEPFQSRLYFFDPRSRDGVTYFIPQINGVNSQALPGFLASNETAQYPASYFDGLLKLWNSAGAQDLTQWLSSHTDIQ